jgi:dTDP-4-dehydrorhamnose 3,5-epimerase
MKPTRLADAVEIEVERHEDERGYFARVWCRDDFSAAGLPVEFVQASISYNGRAGTVRGMHFAWPPAREGKLVRCESGAIFDVIIDLRPESPTFLEHVGLELGAARANALYIPPGFAHGFQTLADETTVGYAMTEVFEPAAAGGFRFDDPAFGVHWPRPATCIIERDRRYPDFDADAYRARCAAVAGAG